MTKVSLTFGTRPAGAGSLGLLDNLELVRQPTAAASNSRGRGHGLVHDLDQTARRHGVEGVGNPTAKRAGGVRLWLRDEAQAIRLKGYTEEGRRGGEKEGGREAVVHDGIGLCQTGGTKLPGDRDLP